LALAWRRRYPLLVTLVTFPGWLTGWAQIAAVVALYTLAKSRPPGWQLVLGTALVWVGRYVQWPPDKTLAFSVGRHIVRLIQGGMISGLPVALGLLMTTRKDLSQRITELAASRERERRLHTQAVRIEERARLAREMHDLVSHQVTLIAMQAGALQVAGTEPDSRRIAATIRQLSTRTLDELRQLVGLLRATEDAAQPGLDQLDDLVRGCGVDVALAIDVTGQPVPPAVSNAVYRTVQEALTNVGKHAFGATTTVGITDDGDDLRVAVHNERPSQQHRPTGPSGGHGLIGLRERATLLGGSFHAGPTPDGGFAIRATFPLAYTPALSAATDPVERPLDDPPR
jgi:signal transduction histidine kinase